MTPALAYEKICVACGKAFTTSIARAQTCSSTCRGRKLRAKRAEAMAADLGIATVRPVAAVEPPSSPGRELRTKLDGLSPAILDRLAARVAARNGENIDTNLRAITTEKIKTLVDDKIARVFDWLDDAAMAMSSGKELTIMGGVLLDKRAMLAQEPPQPLSAGERARLPELLERAQRELARRAAAAKLVDQVPTAGTQPSDSAKLRR
jgi:hypothetical protein